MAELGWPDAAKVISWLTGWLADVGAGCGFFLLLLVSRGLQPQAGRWAGGWVVVCRLLGTQNGVLIGWI